MVGFSAENNLFLFYTIKKINSNEHNISIIAIGTSAGEL
jgi:hypothetical protein